MSGRFGVDHTVPPQLQALLEQALELAKQRGIAVTVGLAMPGPEGMSQMQIQANHSSGEMIGYAGQAMLRAAARMGADVDNLPFVQRELTPEDVEAYRKFERNAPRKGQE